MRGGAAMQKTATQNRATASKRMPSLAMSFDLFSGVLFLAVPVLALGYCVAMRFAHPSMAIFDLFVFAYDPSEGLPLLWFGCPLLTMAYLAHHWKQLSSAPAIVATGSRMRNWAFHLRDIVLTSLIFAAWLHICLLLAGFVLLGVPLDSEFRIFSRYTDGQMPADFSFANALAIMLPYAILVLIFSNTFFLILQQVVSTVPAYFIVALFAYPDVHKPYSFIYDIVVAIGGSLAGRNPISYIYHTATVFYPSWLPGQSHNLWFLVLLVGIAIFLSWLVMRKKEFLGAKRS